MSLSPRSAVNASLLQGQTKKDLDDLRVDAHRVDELVRDFVQKTKEVGKVQGVYVCVCLCVCVRVCVCS